MGSNCGYGCPNDPAATGTPLATFRHPSGLRKTVDGGARQSKAMPRCSTARNESTLMYEHAIRYDKDASIAENGALVAYSGARTARWRLMANVCASHGMSTSPSGDAS